MCTDGRGRTGSVQFEGPTGPQSDADEGGPVVHVDEDVDALLSGEIDREEFDRRVEEKDPRETGTVTRFPHEEGR